MQAVCLIQEMRHAMRLHGEVAALVCDRRVRHAVNWTMGRHDQTRVLSILPWNIAQHTVALNNTRARGWRGSVQEVIKEPLGVLS